MIAESAYRVFFETYDNLEAAKVTIKTKYSEAFDNDTKRMLEEKSKDLRRVVDEVPFLRDIKGFRKNFVADCADTFWAYKTVKSVHQIESRIDSNDKARKLLPRACGVQ